MSTRPRFLALPSFPSVVLVVAALLLAGSAWSRPSPGATQAPPASWPPSPDQVVNVTGERSFGKGETTEEIYAVPGDAWFVLTDFRRIYTGNLDPELDLMMRQKDSRALEMVLPYRFSETSFSSSFGDAGLKFPPGSTVVLKRNERGSATQPSQFLLVGYLLPA